MKSISGKQPDGPYSTYTAAKDVAMRMVQPIEGTNRNVTGDNWFTSIPMTEELLDAKKLTYVAQWAIFIN